MYERFRDELMIKLSSLDSDTVKKVMQAVDTVASRYEMKKISTELIVYQQGLP